MLVIPSLQLRAGVVVRSAQQSGESLEFTRDPMEAAQAWSSLGFHRLEVAITDEGDAMQRTAALIEDIVRYSDLEVQASGDLDRTERIEQLLEAGASSVVLGTRALDDPDWLGSAADLFPGALVVAASVDDRTVLTRGWRHSVRANLLELASDIAGMPIGGLLIRDTSGSMWSNAELALFEELAETGSPPLLVESSSADFEALHALENRGVNAVIIAAAALGAAIDPRRVAYEFAS